MTIETFDGIESLIRMRNGEKVSTTEDPNFYMWFDKKTESYRCNDGSTMDIDEEFIRSNNFTEYEEKKERGPNDPNFYEVLRKPTLAWYWDGGKDLTTMPSKIKDHFDDHVTVEKDGGSFKLVNFNTDEVITKKPCWITVEEKQLPIFGTFGHLGFITVDNFAKNFERINDC